MATSLTLLPACSGDQPPGKAAERQADGTATGAAGRGSARTPPSSSTRPDLTAEVTIGASGDLLTHVAVRRSAEAYAGAGGSYDFVPMFGKVRPLIEAADVALCHLETPLTSTNDRLSQPGVLVFNTPHELADAAVAAGYEGCDFASNHTWDQGLAGLADTIRVFKKAGLGYAGPGATESAGRRVATYETSGLTIAHLAYTYTIFNNWGPNTDVPSDAPWLAGSLWPATGPEGILRDAKAAKKDGADIVVVSLHWGQEYVAEPTADQSEVAESLLGSDEVDLILGTHVHRVQPCERINGKYVFYGLGNFLSNQSPSVDASLIPQTQEGLYVAVTFRRGADGAMTSTAAYLPTRVDLNGHVVEPATRASNRVTFDRVTDVLTSIGGCPLTVLKP